MSDKFYFLHEYLTVSLLKKLNNLTFHRENMKRDQLALLKQFDLSLQYIVKDAQKMDFKSLSRDKLTHQKRISVKIQHLMSVRDKKGALEIVSQNCLEWDRMTQELNPERVLTENLADYAEAIERGDYESVNSLLIKDQRNRKIDFKEARPKDFDITQEAKIMVQDTSKKLQSLTVALTDPLEKSRIITGNMTASGILYFHFTGSSKWFLTLFPYCPKDGPKDPISLPNNFGFNLRDSCIVQVEESLLVFKFGDQVLTYQLDNLSTGNPVSR